jgi:potassium-transporting ATPase KdpC subunit
MGKKILTSIKLFLVLTLLAGIIYPLIISAISIFLFPNQANGSMITLNGKIVGSKLIGQKFVTEKYFWSRPSAIDYNPFPSGASNLAPTSAALKNLYETRKETFAKSNLIKNSKMIPNEMLFASGSGVDPDITPEAAFLQVERICNFRKFSVTQKNELIRTINQLIENSQIGFLGERRINVLLLNMELDKIK